MTSTTEETARDRSRSPPRGPRPYDIFTPQLRAQVDARASRPRDRPEPDPEPEPGEDLHRRAQHLRAAAALWDIFDSDPRQARPTRVGRWDQEGGRLNMVLPSGEPVIGHPYFPVGHQRRRQG